MENSSKIEAKVVLLGKGNVGKSCIVQRYLYNRFKDTSATVGAAFGAKKEILENGTQILLGIWDTAGLERFESINHMYFRGAKAAVLCYDLTEAASWSKVILWAKTIQENEPTCKLYVVGCKKDLIKDPEERGIDPKEVSKYVKEINAKYFETSSKSGEGIDALFRQIAEDFAINKGIIPDPERIRLNEANSHNQTETGCSC